MTPRMRRAWLLAALGKTNKEIAVAMVLSEQSVKNLLRRVYDVLGVRNRAEAVRRALSYPFPDTTAQDKSPVPDSGSVRLK